MAQVYEALALFDVTSGGDLFVPLGLPADTGPSQFAEGEWQEGRLPLSQEERSLTVALPDSMNVTRRAGHLVHALNAMSGSNRDRGFVKAAVSPAYRSRVERHSGVATDDVAAELAARSLAGKNQARHEFFAASGVGHLAVATAETPLSPADRVTRRVVDESWRSFCDRYAGTGADARKKRAAFKKLLEQQIEQGTEA